MNRPKKQYAYPKPEHTGYASGTHTSRPEYHTARWQRMRKIFLSQPQNLFCVRCKAQGRTTLAKVVDHIIPAEICGDFWNTNNWQPLCRRCNDVKAAEDKALIQKHRQAIGGCKSPAQSPF